MEELYLELLCQYERGSILKFPETFENYSVEHCLRLCQDYEITDAAAFLLERVGDVGSALSLSMSGLDGKLKMIDAALENKVLEMVSSSFTDVEQFNNILQINEVKDVFDILHVSIGLCQRNTLCLHPNGSGSLWLWLLDSFGEPLRSLYAEKRKFSEVANHGNKVAATSKTQADKEPSINRWRISTFEKGSKFLQIVLFKFISEIIDGMVGYVPLPTIIAKILSDNANHEIIGVLQKSVAELEKLSMKRTGVYFYLPSSLYHQKRSKGQLFVDRFHEKVQYTFLDYISSGFELIFMVAIEFTASSGNPQVPDSLHYIDPSGRLNAYQQAIVEVEEVIQFYDTDGHFPARGFGWRVLYGFVSHCFNLNGSPHECEVDGVEGIMSAYTSALHNVALAGPTIFGPVINQIDGVEGIISNC